ncbi:hypothetical protein RI129_002306 [Pyrocoelia pectoralis]|uniref:Uncharacterized protein n=1 Tax=Pyrocoelia pectoralis TaxID=417401 RepID=A0AAN7VNK2_9COLE
MEIINDERDDRPQPRKTGKRLSDEHSVRDSNGTIIYDSSVKNFLDIIVQTARLNRNKIKNNKFDSDLLQFCSYLFLICGRLGYETFYVNLKKSIPSPTVICRSVQNLECIDEATVRFQQLSIFLNQNNLPRVIWVSEDGTGITGKIQYCKSLDSIVGFVSPLGQNGWKFLKESAQRHDIRILGFSSDGDTRLLKCMRIRTNFQQSSKWTWFNMNLNEGDFCTQDTVHILTKLRNRLLNENIELQMGHFKAYLSKKFKFPRASNKQGYSTFAENTQTNKFLTDDQIGEVVEKALKDAKQICQKLKIKIIDGSWNELINLNVYDEVYDEPSNGAEDMLNYEDEGEQDDPHVLESFGELNLKDLTKEIGSSSESNLPIGFVKVNEKVIRKSSLCWLLTKNNRKLSSDRLLRVRGCEEGDKKIPTLFLEKEKYYAIYYTEGWYIGRIIETLTESKQVTYTVKFLEENLGSFNWPKKDDVQNVEKQYFFEGPINLIGQLPFVISKECRRKISIKFKNLKKGEN